MVDENKPLTGCTILITRAREQSQEVIDRIREFGGTAICMPMIEITGPESWDTCDKAIVNIKKYDGVIFTSANAARAFASRIKEHYPHIQDILNQRTVYAVGVKTRDVLSEYGIRTDAVPDAYTADAVVALITESSVAGKTFLLPAGNLTRDVIEKGLTDEDAVVDRVPVYTTKKPGNVDTGRLRQLFTEHTIDVVTFFSPSAVHHFFELLDPSLLRDIPVAVIGNTTYDAVTGYGIHPHIKPDEATGNELVKSIIEYRNS